MSLARLLQLASPALPVGAFSYSGGLEAAVEAGVVTDAASAERWIGDVLEFTVAAMDAPLLLALMHSVDEAAETDRLNAIVLASRETAELRAETLQMGYSLAKLLDDLGFERSALREPSFPAAFARAAWCWKIDPADALAAYLWSWLENQVLAAVKAVPLGQTEAQRMMLSLGDGLKALAEKAQDVPPGKCANFAPGLAVRSARHETQYSRLFRS